MTRMILIDFAEPRPHVLIGCHRSGLVHWREGDMEYGHLEPLAAAVLPSSAVCNVWHFCRTLLILVKVSDKAGAELSQFFDCLFVTASHVHVSHAAPSSSATTQTARPDISATDCLHLGKFFILLFCSPLNATTPSFSETRTGWSGSGFELRGARMGEKRRDRRALAADRSRFCGNTKSSYYLRKLRRHNLLRSMVRIYELGTNQIHQIWSQACR